MLMFSITPSSITHNPSSFLDTNLRNHSKQNSSYSFSIKSSNSRLQVPLDEESENNLSTELLYSRPFTTIKSAKRVVLVRHGQSTWNAEGRIQGSSDFSVLTQKGEAQAETSHQMLVDDSFDICFSSPLNRSKRTAEIIWGTRKEEILTDNDLREIDLYSFQGLLKHELKEKFGESFHEWQINPANYSIDGNYPVRQLWERARNCWDKILFHDRRSVLVVAHNAVNQALIATAMGLGTEYFRVLLQSNCGVSVLDFTPGLDGLPPYICLNRLNQTPGSPVASESSGGRKASKQIILVCHRSSQSDSKASVPVVGDSPMDMLGIIQSQKTAELLLDLRVKTVISSRNLASIATANTIARVQEAADCLGADSVPRYVEMKQVQNLGIDNIPQVSEKGLNDAPQSPGWLNTLEDEVITALWDQSKKAWKSLLDELSSDPENEDIIVAVADSAAHVALLSHCLNVRKEWMGSFHLDDGSISVIDFPDGPAGRGVIRCINYTAHLGRWSIPITTLTMDDEKL